jgi:hypothetical protein
MSRQSRAIPMSLDADDSGASPAPAGPPTGRAAAAGAGGGGGGASDAVAATLISCNPAARPSVPLRVGVPCTIGRGDVNIVVDHASVSRRHCTIVVVKQGPSPIVTLQDSSTYGTFVNKLLVHRTTVELPEGAVVTLVGASAGARGQQPVAPVAYTLHVPRLARCFYFVPVCLSVCLSGWLAVCGTACLTV